MNSTLSLTYNDYSNEKSSFTLEIPLVTAANFAATATLVNNLVAAAVNIIGGTLNRRTLSIPTPASGLVPADELAQREDKWLVGYTDITAELAAGITNPYYGDRFWYTFATADLLNHLSPNSDFADLDNAEVAAFVTAFEALAKSPTGGAVEVNYIEFVGRNH